MLNLKDSFKKNFNPVMNFNLQSNSGLNNSIQSKKDSSFLKTFQETVNNSFEIDTKSLKEYESSNKMQNKSQKHDPEKEIDNNKLNNKSQNLKKNDTENTRNHNPEVNKEISSKQNEINDDSKKDRTNSKNIHTELAEIIHPDILKIIKSKDNITIAEGNNSDKVINTKSKLNGENINPLKDILNADDVKEMLSKSSNIPPDKTSKEISEIEINSKHIESDKENIFIKNSKSNNKVSPDQLKNTENLNNEIVKDNKIINDIKNRISKGEKSKKSHENNASLIKNSAINTDNNSEISINSKDKNIFTVSAESSSNTGNSGENNSSFNFSDKNTGNMNFKNNTEFKNFNTNKSGLFKQQLNDIINKANITVKENGSSSMSMKMFPEKLGHLNVNLGMENGTLTGRFLVETAEAKEVLMSDLDLLKAKLAEQGINVSSFEVNVRSGKKQFSSNSDNQENIINNLGNILNNDDKEEFIDEYEINETDYRSSHLNMVI